MSAPGPPPTSSGRAVTPPAPGGARTGEPALAAAVRAVAAGGRLEATLHGIVEAAVACTDATCGALGVLSSDGRRVDRYVVVGVEPASDGSVGTGGSGPRAPWPAPLHPSGCGASPSPDGTPAGAAALGVPVRVREEVFGTLHLAGKRSGGPFTTADEEAVLALAAVAGLAVENARLAEAAERRRAWVQAGTEVAAALLSDGGSHEGLHTLVSRAAELSGADGVALLVPADDGPDALTIVAAVGPEAADLEGVRVPVADTHVGRVHRSGTAEHVEDVRADPVLGRHAEVAVELASGARSAVVVPLGPAIGTLVCLRRAERESFDAEVLDPLVSFAAQAAVALELTRTQHRERLLQVQADRDRIARDLHDHVVQRIYATALSLDRVARSLEEVDPYTAGRVERSVDELDETIAQIRSAIFELHEGPVRPQALTRRLTDVVARVTEGSGVDCRVELLGPVDAVSGALGHELLAVLRELVSNVVRHAAATRVTVTVDAGRDPGDDVVVVVADDGRGMPAVALRSGLANLEERARRRGGALGVRGDRGGTAVTWRAPRAGGA